MKKKIMLIIIMILALAGLSKGINTVEVYADADDVPSLLPPSPHP